jgi:hypothetical protein
MDKKHQTMIKKKERKRRKGGERGRKADLSNNFFLFSLRFYYHFAVISKLNKKTVNE